VALIGRTRELSALTGLLERAAGGDSAVMLLRGEPGIGKTALLEAVSESAATRGMTTASVTGVESEAPLGYAALHRLLRFFPGSVERLPAPQRDALRITLGLDFGPPPDRFLVGLGVLTLLADAASDAPLLIVIDDAQWLDSESGTVLGFAARRLQAERVVMLFAAREADEGLPWLSALPELMIDRLGDRDAAQLLSEVTSVFLSPGTQARLLEECRGNPLTLVEIAGQLTPDQLAGTAVIPDPLPAAGSLHQLLVRRLEHLTAGDRLLLAVAAAEPTASERLVRGVARRLGANTESDAEVHRLVTFGDVIQFRHPLVRSAAYYSMPLYERRRIHGELAREMDSPQNPDRVAWHLAMATTGPDEAVAGKLEQAAQRMRDRGGYAASAALLRRAAALSVDEHHRTDRLLHASETALTAGRPDQARAVLEEARRGLSDERQAAFALRLSGEALFATGAAGDAARELLAAAKALLAFDQDLGRQTLLSALIAAEFAAADVLAEVRSFATSFSQADLSPGDLHTVTDLFLFGFLHRLAGNAALAARLMRKAFSDLERSEPPDDLRAHIPPIVPAAASAELLDRRAGFIAARSYTEFARDAGALMVLPNALVFLATVYIHQGHFEEAEVALTEASQLGRATGAPGTPDITTEQRVFLLCWRGDEAEALAQAAVLTAAHEQPGPGLDLASGHLALLELSSGRYRDAFERLEPIARQDRLGFGTLMLADFIEAAARSGQRSEAVAALDRLAIRASAGAAQMGLGRLARCRALLADDDQAEGFYQESIEVLRDADLTTDLARSHLVYGEWLRRQRRRREARSQLGAAFDAFAGMGAKGFAARARTELRATGGHARARHAGVSRELTAQETQVATLVVAGDTNREAAAKLFISPATVEYHLRHVYQKFGVSSRTQLARSMALKERELRPVR
jgi:DNA-binding CsgD family transcriptional regulator/tetratricopeptide (TPR) repeat protein